MQKVTKVFPQPSNDSFTTAVASLNSSNKQNAQSTYALQSTNKRNRKLI